jgi:hypothetical protein
VNVNQVFLNNKEFVKNAYKTVQVAQGNNQVCVLFVLKDFFYLKEFAFRIVVINNFLIKYLKSVKIVIFLVKFVMEIHH